MSDGVGTSEILDFPLAKSKVSQVREKSAGAHSP